MILAGLSRAEQRLAGLIRHGWDLLDTAAGNELDPAEPEVDLLDVDLPRDEEAYEPLLRAVLHAASWVRLDPVALILQALWSVSGPIDDEVVAHAVQRTTELWGQPIHSSPLPPALDYVEPVHYVAEPYVEVMTAVLLTAQMCGCDINGIVLAALARQHDDVQTAESGAAARRADAASN